MAHHVEKNNDIIYANYQIPWHGLGVPIDGLFTSRDALSKADLNFTVVKKPIYRNAVLPQQQTVQISNKFETVRTDTDTHLGVVGNYYTPYQNVDAFDFIDSLVAGNKAIYDTAGALFGGRKVWMLVKLPQDIIVGNDDAINKFLLVMNSHDGSTPILVRFTPIRVVCYNTLSAALGDWKHNIPHVIKIRHTASVDEKMREAARILGIATAYFEETHKIYGEMANFKIDSVLLKRYYNDVLSIELKDACGEDIEEDITTRTEIMRNSLINIFESSPAIIGTPGQGTLWGAYNAVTEYVQYYKKVNQEDKKEGKRFALITANDPNMRQKAFSSAVELLKA